MSTGDRRETDPVTPEFDVLVKTIRKYKTIAIATGSILSTLLVQSGWGIVTTKDKITSLQAEQTKFKELISDSLRVIRHKTTSIELEIATSREKTDFAIELLCALVLEGRSNREFGTIRRKCNQYIGEIGTR